MKVKHVLIKYIVVLFLIAAVPVITIGFTRAGDIFLAFIGKKIHVDIDYKNHSGFVSCFLLKFIELKNPVFLLKDFGLPLSCENAFIQPKFDRLIKEKKITLDCAFKNASFLTLGERMKENENLFLKLLQGDLYPLFERLANQVFENMYAKLVIYGETLEFSSFDAQGEYVKLYASGAVSESGTFDINARIFFSPEIVKDFPAELKDMLTKKAKGWASYYVYIKSGRNKSFLRLESDRFKLNFEQLDVNE